MNLKRHTLALLCAYTPFFCVGQVMDSAIERFSVHAQTTVINQYKPAFKVKYTGSNSLLPETENKTSITSTLYLGARLWRGATAYLNPEIAGGSGLSGALGVAAATNGETFRIGDPAPKIYLARLFFRQLFPLTSNTTYQEAAFNQLAGNVPTRYLAVTVGKIGAADYFDNNKYSHDPRTQFMSWALMDVGAWDYPANTRGYTPGIVLEYVSPLQELRYSFSLVPLVANGNDMNWNISRAGSSTVEYTRHYQWGPHPGTIRLLGFYNRANMGNYRQSLEMSPVNPNILLTRSYGRNKYGFAVNAEQDFSDHFGAFFRAGWNDGQNETWVFTEIDHSISGGLSLDGASWKRTGDRAALAYVASGISGPHRDYLRAGGDGFILGDGNLNYAWEHLLEIYYSAELVPNELYLTGAYQLVVNPGYNLDRHGPVNIFSIRFHAQF